MLIMVSPFNVQDAPPATPQALDRARMHFAALRQRAAKIDMMTSALVRVKTKHTTPADLPPACPSWLRALPVIQPEPARVNLKAIAASTSTLKRGRGRPRKDAA